QDQNGAWPFDLAQRKNFSDVAAVLKRQWDLDIKDFNSFLEQAGYIEPNKFADAVAREQAVKMFQRSAYIKTTGFVSFETLANAEYELRHQTPIQYAIIYRYKWGKELVVRADVGPHANAAAARVSAMEFCQKTFNHSCKIYLIPSGGCLAGFAGT